MKRPKLSCTFGAARRSRCFKFIFAISLAILLLAACSSSPSPSARVAYQLPFVPVQFSINSSGVISLSVADSIVTPFGTFSISADIAKNLKPEANTFWLVIRHREDGNLVDTVYEIYTDQEIVVDLDGKITLQFTNRTCFINASSGSASVLVRSAITPEGRSANPESVAPTAPIDVVQSQPNDDTIVVAWQNTASNADYIQVCAIEPGSITYVNICKNLLVTATSYTYYFPNGVDEYGITVGACNKAGCSNTEPTPEPPGISALAVGR